MTLGFDAVCDQLVVHCTAAGATLSPKLTDVAFAVPIPPGRCIRIFYVGEAEPARMGAKRDLTGELIAEVIRIVAFWPLSSGGTTYTGNIEAEARALKHEIRTRILGDSQFGGQSTDLEVTYANMDFGNVNGTPFRTLEMDVITDYVEYPIAP